MATPEGESVKFLKWMLLLVMLCASLASAKEIPVKDFFRDSAFEDVVLSPDGKYIAVVVPQPDRSVLAVLRIEDMKLIGKWDYGENRHFNGVVWRNRWRREGERPINTGPSCSCVGR